MPSGALLPLITLMANNTGDRKSTRLNSSHANISYAVFCLKKKKTRTNFAATRRTNSAAFGPTRTQVAAAAASTSALQHDAESTEHTTTVRALARAMLTLAH